MPLKHVILSAVYQIQVPDSVPEDTSGYSLYVDTGSDHLSFTVLNKAEGEFIALQHFNLEKNNGVSHAREIIEHSEWLKKAYGHTVVVYNFSESILVPEKFYLADLNEQSLELVYGDAHKGELFADHIPEWGLYHIYRVPAALHDALSGYFRNARFSHVYTCLLKTAKQNPSYNSDGDELYAVFYNNKLIVSLLKTGELQLLRSFEYETAEDVVYYLLNICKQYGVDCEKVSLVISGLIADHSVMYAELQKYFMFLTLKEEPAGFKYGEAFNEYPSHFFTSIFNTALCE